MTATGNRRRNRAAGQHGRSTAPRPKYDRQNGTARSGAGRSGAGRSKVDRLKADRRQAQRRRARRRAIGLWSVVVVAIAGIVTAAMLVTRSGSTQSNAVRRAPAFSLLDTNGRTVSLAGYRGRDVVLYFNEGVGCDTCFYQMAELERHAADLTKAGITILPIVMNPAPQVAQQLARFKLRTPYLIDATGSVSRAYGALGKGMHSGLPGHGFALIDAAGHQRWYGEYPSMYLSTSELLKQVRTHLNR